MTSCIMTGDTKDIFRTGSQVQSTEGACVFSLSCHWLLGSSHQVSLGPCHPETRTDSLTLKSLYGELVGSLKYVLILFSKQCELVHFSRMITNNGV